jgi:hypothetical protein
MCSRLQPPALWLQVAENFLSLSMLRTVLDTLLGCDFQVTSKSAVSCES